MIEFFLETAKKAEEENFKRLLNELDMTMEEYYQDIAYKPIKNKLLENKLFDDITASMDTPEEKAAKWNDF